MQQRTKFVAVQLIPIIKSKFKRMSDIDLQRWNVADMHVNESIVASRIDTDAYSKLKTVEYNKKVKVSDTATEVDVEKDSQAAKGGSQAVKPNQVHHFATGKSKTYTNRFEDITPI